MLFNKYPYTDFHELNLDWIIRMIKALDEAMDDFVAYNKVTFAGVWNGSPYPAWTVVDDGSGNGYMSITAVPANVPLTDTSYWTPVASYSMMYSAFNSRITALENSYVPNTRTVNGHALSSNVSVISSDIPYNNAVSGLSATNVKAALDEIDSFTDTLKAFTSASWTENGITYKVCRSGNICELLAESGTSASAFNANDTIANLPVGYEPRYIAPQAVDIVRGARVGISIGGAITTASALSAGDLVRFYVSYIGQ